MAIAPLAYTCATLMLMVFIGNRLFGRPSGYVAAIALAVTPAFAVQALQPAADGTELTWLLASFAAALMAYDQKSWRWALTAGVALGIAAQTRDTSLAMFPIAAVAIAMLSRRNRAMLWMIPGMISPIIIEGLVYWMVAGDPLWRFRLAVWACPHSPHRASRRVRHDPEPFIQSALHRGMKARSGDFAVLADPPVAQPPRRISLGVTSSRPSAGLVRRLLVRAARPAIAGAAYRRRADLPCALIYGLAIDPKARMFFVLASAVSLAIGAIAVRAWRGGGRLGVVTIFAAFVPFASLIVATQN